MAIDGTIVRARGVLRVSWNTPFGNRIRLATTDDEVEQVVQDSVSDGFADEAYEEVDD